MITYQDYEKTVYDWLMSKNKIDSTFTFSLRQNASKGAELDYFIGTEKSNYFSTTFWTIPVSFPGSSGDCIGLIFGYSKTGYRYYFDFDQTNSPEGSQNVTVLALIKSLRDDLSIFPGLEKETSEKNKMYNLRTKTNKQSYSSIEDMLTDVSKDIEHIIPLVNKHIETEKKRNPEFDAHRIRQDEFEVMNKKYLKRLTNHNSESVNQQDDANDNLAILNSKFQIALSKYNQEDLKTYFDFLRLILKRYDLKPNDKRLFFCVTKNNLNFTIGQRYCWNLFLSEPKGKFGVISKIELNQTSELFPGFQKSAKAFFTNLSQFNPTDEQLSSIFDAIDLELKRSKSSSFTEKKNIEFENFSFESISPIFKNPSDSPKNQILYGPPGTGKTFKLKDQYFPIYTTKETLLSSEQHFKNVVSDCSWWQVIALALMELGASSKVADIMNNRWVKKKSELSEAKSIRPIIWSCLQSHTIQTSETVGVKQRQAPFIFNKKNESYWEILEIEVREQIPELFDMIESVNNFNPSADKQIQRYVFTTFHQSYSYEDFIEGIKPIMIEGEVDGNVAYHIEDGVFKQLCKKAALDPENRYAIFIDEINRGNVSAIFGELITLIEQDKRKDASNAMSALLPYSKKQFSVPQNVDIYGTMNTADRSVEALDTALRRRFSFEEMLPQPELLKDKGENGSGKVGNIVLEELLITINERIEALVDRDHTIGHAFFMEVYSLDSLRNVFANKVIPLLQEYFYGDYAKMEMVIGSDFFNIKDSSKIKFAVKPEEFETTGKTYQIRNLSDKIIMSDDMLLEALDKLIKGVA